MNLRLVPAGKETLCEKKVEDAEEEKRTGEGNGKAGSLGDQVARR